MKKIFGLIFGLFVFCDAYAGTCVPVSDMLAQGGNPDYDDYLYADSQQYELRKEGKKANAYLCGAGYCEPGTKIRLKNGKVGAGAPNADAVYECKNTSPNVGDRTSYQWVVHVVHPVCSVNSIMLSVPVSDVQDSGNEQLMMADGKYCVDVTTKIGVFVDETTNGWDFAKTVVQETGETIRSVVSKQIDGGVAIVVNLSNNTVKTFEIATNGVVSVIDSVGRTTIGTLQVMADGTYKVVDSLGKTVVGSLEVMADGTVRLLDSAGKVVQTLSDNATKRYMKTLDFLTAVVQEAGQTVRAVSSDVKDVIVNTTDNATELMINYANNQTERFRIYKNGQVEFINAMGKMVVGSLSVLTDGAVEITSNAIDGAVEMVRIGVNGKVEIVKQGAEVVKQLSADSVKKWQAAMEVAKVALQEAGQTVRALSGDIKDVSVTAIKGGVEITGKVIDGGTKIVKYTLDTTGNIVATVGGVTVQVYAKTVDGVVKIFDDATDTVIMGLNILSNGTIQILNATGKIVGTIAAAATEAYKATLQFMGCFWGELNETARVAIQSAASMYNVTITQIGQTVRAVSSDVKDVIVNTTDNATELVINYANNQTERFRIATDGTVTLISGGLNLVGATIENTINGGVEIITNMSDNTTRRFEIAADGVVSFIQEGGRVITALASENTERLKTVVGLWKVSIQEKGETIRTIVSGGVSIVETGIQTTGSIIETSIEERFGFAKHFVSEMRGMFSDVYLNEGRLDALEKEIQKRTTEKEVADLIERALKDAELSDVQCKQVQDMIDAYAKKNNARLDQIDKRIDGLVQELQAVKQLTQETADKVEKLGGQYRNLAAQMRTKVNARQVVKLIVEYTNQFSDGQTKQLNQILDEYTKKLSAGQRAEVQGMIKEYVDPKIRDLNKKFEVGEKRRIATDKIQSVMGTLNSFMAGADVSVWKNEEGKFNAVRLASDATAGVVLGTAGGLISNALIKKSQVKKGLENVTCTVGGQVVAGYGDEFMVGIQ